MNFLHALQYGTLQECQEIASTFEYSNEKPAQKRIEQFLCKYIEPNNLIMIPHLESWKNLLHGLEQGEKLFYISHELSLNHLFILKHLKESHVPLEKYHTNLSSLLNNITIRDFILECFEDMGLILQYYHVSHTIIQGIQPKHETWIIHNLDKIETLISTERWATYASMPWTNPELRYAIYKYFIPKLDGYTQLHWIQKSIINGTCHTFESLTYLLKEQPQIQKRATQKDMIGLALEYYIFGKHPELETIFELWTNNHRRLDFPTELYQHINDYFTNYPLKINPDLRRRILTYLYQHQVKREDKQPVLHWFGLHLKRGHFVTDVQHLMTIEYNVTKSMKERGIENSNLHSLGIGFSREELFHSIEEELSNKTQLTTPETTIFL